MNEYGKSQTDRFVKSEYKCPYCGNIFSSEDELTNHLNTSNCGVQAILNLGSERLIKE